MKLSVTTTGSLVNGTAARTGRVETLSRSLVRRLSYELEEELQHVIASERAADADADPEFRRDALARAVRRVWGAAL